nr:GNAT family N-acetyltransferase [Secundilactobacillus folii]
MTLWLSGNLDAHPFISEEYWQEHENEVAGALKTAEVYVVRDDNGEIVGFAGMQGQRLTGIFVKAGQRNDGLGSLLMFALKSDYRLIKASAFEKNANAIHFYKQHDFDISERELNQETNEVVVKMIWQA